MKITKLTAALALLTAASVTNIALIPATAAFGQSSVSFATDGNSEVTTASDKIDLGIMPELVGRIWENGQGYKATVFIAEDGRYIFKSVGIIFYINPGIATAPSTMVQYAGTNLSQSTFEAGPNGLILTETGSRKFRTYLFLTPEDDLRLVTVRIAKEGAELLGYSEYVDLANLQPGLKAAESPRIQGKEMGPELEALLGVKIANLDQLIYGSEASPVRLAEAKPPSQTEAAQSRNTVAFRQSADSAPVRPAKVAPENAVPANPKLWASLLPLIDTQWRTSSDVLTIGWDRPGESILMTWNGLFGETEVIILPSSDGQKLRHVYNGLYSKSKTERLVKPKSGRATIGFNQSYDTECTVSKKTGRLDCRLWSLNGGKRNEVNGLSLEPLTPQGAQAFLAQLPVQFPSRNADQFHPVLGAFGEMADANWTQITKFEDPANRFGYSPLIEVRGNKANYTVIYGGGQVVALSGASTLSGRSADPVSDNPGRSIPYTLQALSDGSTQICNTHPYDNKTECESWRISSDGEYAMRIIVGQPISFFRRQKVQELDAKLKVFAKLDRRYFDRGGGRAISFSAYDAAANYIYFDDEGQLSLNCGFIAGTSEIKCNDSTSRTITLNDNSFSIRASSGTDRYELVPGAILWTDAAGKQTRWPEMSRGVAELNWKNNRDEREYRRALVEYRQIQREKAESDRRLAQQWGQILYDVGRIAGGGGGGNAFQPSTPSDWAGSVPSAPTAGMTGYEGLSVSRTIYSPPMTPAQRAEQDEYQRMKIREELYGKRSSSATASSSRSTQQLRDEHAAGYQASEDEYAAKNAADRAQLDARREADAASYEARQKADYDRLRGKGASSTSGGSNALTVTDGRNPQAEAEAERRQQANNAAGDAQRKAAADAALAVEKGQEEEAKRIADQQKRQAGPEDACERSRRLAREAAARGEKLPPGSAVCM